MAKQLALFKDPRRNTKLWWITKRSVYGGSLNYRKVKRPFDSRKLTHIVLKASLGRTIWFTRFQSRIHKVIDQAALRYGVKIKDLAINHDHIHLLTYTKCRESQIRFLRLVSAQIGRKYKKIRGHGKLWAARPFTRLVSWGRKSVFHVQNYLHQNRAEATGFVEYRPRRHAITKFLAQWSAQSFSSS